MSKLQATRPALHLTVIRVLASLPLLFIGTLHLIGEAPMLPILEGARILYPELFAWLVPVLEVLAGALLLLGLHARLGALLAAVIMAVAIYAHLVHDWADEPVLLLPIAVLLGSVQVFWSGAGAFSTDLALHN